MPPRPTARRCRATVTQHHKPIEAVWVTDEVLSRAFQQYVHATGHKIRAVSSAPGPLYHRQRLGRRRMTELNSFQSAGSIPVWALPNAPDMTKWQWQPPRPPSFWPQPPPVEDEIEADNSPLLLEPEAEVQPLVAPEPLATLTPRETVKARQRIMLPTLAETTSPLGLQLQALLNDTIPAVWVFRKKYRAFTRSLRKEISDGRLRGPQIFEVYNLGRRALVRASRAMPCVQLPLSLSLLSRVIYGMETAKKLNPSFLRTNPQHWIILLKHVARLEANAKSAQLFALLMEVIPPKCHFKTRGAILNVLSTFFRLWQGSSIHGNPPEGLEFEAAKASQLAAMWIGRADECLTRVKSELASNRLENSRAHLKVAERLYEKASRFTSKAAHLLSDDIQLVVILADALKNLDPTIHRSLFVIATRLTGNEGRWTRLRYNWLQILARLPKVHNSQFKSLLELFQKRGHGALSQTELGGLLIFHWKSTGMLEKPRDVFWIWKKCMGGEDTMPMAALAVAINACYPPNQCTAIFWSFWDFMRLWVGPKTVIKQILSLSSSKTFSVGFLKRLAWTSKDYRIALMLHDILVKQNGNEINMWGPNFWEKYATQQMRRPKHAFVNPVVLVERLVSSAQPAEALCQASDGKPQGESKRSDLKLRWIMRIKESIKIIACAPALTERQRFRHTAAFTKYLSNVQGFLTARDLASITNVITEALKRGEGGSTERLRWYLGIVLEQLGEEACVNVGMVLKRRRELNGRRLSDLVKPQEPVVEQQTVPDLHRGAYTRPLRGGTIPLWRYYLPKNRRRTKLRRSKEKRDPRIPRLWTHEERPCEAQNC